jgi:hypothetical protein
VKTYQQTGNENNLNLQTSTPPENITEFALQLIIVADNYKLPRAAHAYFTADTNVLVKAETNMQVMIEQLRRIVHDVYVDFDEYSRWGSAASRWR